MLELASSDIKVEPEAVVTIDDDECSNDVVNHCLQEANGHKPQKQNGNFVSPIGKENCVGNEIGRLKHEPELVIFDVHQNIPVIVRDEYPLVTLRDCLATRTSVLAPLPKTQRGNGNYKRILADEMPSVEHFEIDRLESTKSFQCYKCRKTFHDDKECRRHMFSVCLSNKVPIVRLVDCMKGHKANQKLSTRNSRRRSGADGCKYECYVCKKKVDNEKSLQKHLTESHACESLRQMNVTKKRSQIRDKTENIETPYACDYPECHRKYKSKYDLRYHIITHSGKREHLCTYPNCSGSFFTGKALNMHKRICHSNERKYVCGYKNCGKKFKTNSCVSVHEKIHNANARLHVCKYANCGKAFITKSKLDRHQPSHDKNRPRPYLCTFPQCEKSYASKEMLNVHATIHMDKLYACDQCDRKFRWKEYLKRHKSLHSDVRPFACDHNDCGKSFKSKAELKTHKFIHSDERHFACAHPNCDKKFKTIGLLYFHSRVHSSDKPFVCTTLRCGKAFKSKPNLQRHQRQQGHDGIHKGNGLECTKSFQCYKCWKTFHDDKECRRHIFSLCLGKRILT